MYDSHNDEIRDVASGLIGPMIVSARGLARPDGLPTDVDCELVAGFIEVDENHSWYVEENIAIYTTNPKGTSYDAFGDMTVRRARQPARPRRRRRRHRGLRCVVQGDDERLLATATRRG